MLAELALELMKLVLGSGPGEMDGVAVPLTVGAVVIGLSMAITSLAGVFDGPAAIAVAVSF